jgi:hypothetical protein
LWLQQALRDQKHSVELAAVRERAELAEQQVVDARKQCRELDEKLHDAIRARNSLALNPPPVARPNDDEAKFVVKKQSAQDVLRELERLSSLIARPLQL